MARLGIVAAGHPETCEAAARLLRSGGNAFDAALAAGFAAAVAEPMLCSLGGGGFLLARGADGSERLFDFFTDTPGRGLPDTALEPHFVPMTVHFPASDQVFNIGLGAIAVPGVLAGLLHAHRSLGRAPLADVVAPARRLAREGVVLNAHQAYALELLAPIHGLTERSRRLFSPGGRVPRAGERLANRDLADFLETLPDGAEDFHRGALARRVAEEMRAGQGLLTAADLAAYRVVERAPLALEYRGRRILTNPPPSFGGSLVALSLRLHAGLPHAGGWGAPADVRRHAAVMVEVEALRERALEGRGALPPGEVDASLSRLRRASGGTTHVSACDAEGNAASLSLSNGEGSGYVAPGTGIMLNNMLGEDDLHPHGFHASEPGARVASMMAPTVVLRGGEVELVLGSGGSKRIRSALVQVISAVLDGGLAVGEAVEAPRLHWDGERLQVEPGFAADALAALEREWPLNRWPERNLYFGGVHAVDPRSAGAGDSRRGGCAQVVES